MKIAKHSVNGEEKAKGFKGHAENKGQVGYYMGDKDTFQKQPLN